MVQYTTLKGAGSGCGCSGSNVFEIIGDGVTTAFPITHGMNTKEIIISTRQAATPFANVNIAAEYTSNTVVTFTFPVAPAVGEVFIVMMQRVTYSFAITGDGVTTAFVITHNLGTKNIIVGFRQTFSPYAKVNIPFVYTSVNSITVTFSVAPGSGEIFRINLIPLC